MKEKIKEIYKKPALYYVLVPVVVALWPLLLWGVYLPNAEKTWDHQKALHEKSQQIMAEILALDADRLQFADAKTPAAEFDYATAVEKVANLCRIPSSDYKLTSGMLVTSGGQKSQTARVTLRQVSVTKCAEFLSAIHLRWANLQCNQLKLTKRKGLPDTWDVDFDFKYYF